MTFDPQPTLAGDTIVVRPLREDDWTALFAAASDPEIWAQHPARDRYQEDVFRAFFSDAIASGSAFAIEDRVTGEMLGSSRYHGADSEKSEIEIGWTFLKRSCWGGAVNREVKRLMLAHAFASFSTVVFWIGEDNLRSRRAVEKIGATLREGVFDRGGDPYVVYAIREPQSIA